MADKETPNYGLADIPIDQEDIRRYRQIVAPTPTLPPPPQVDHPIVQYARRVLSPLANYPAHGGLAGPSQAAPTSSFSMNPAMPPGFNSRAAPADQRGAEQNIFTPGNRFEDPHSAAAGGYETPIIGAIQRVTDTVGGRQGMVPALGEALEGAHTFAKAGAAISHIIADKGVRDRFESLTKQIAAKTGRSESDPFVRMAAGALVEDERPDAFSIPVRDLVKTLVPAGAFLQGAVPEDAAIGEKGLSEMLFDPFNVIGGVGFEKAVISAVAKGSRAGASAAIRGTAGQAERIAQQAAQAVPEQSFLRGESGFVQKPGTGPLTQRFQANAAGKAATEAPGEAANLRLAAASGEAVAPGTGAALKPGSTLAERQMAALKAAGATDQEIADFAKTMAPSVGAGPTQPVLTRVGNKGSVVLKDGTVERAGPLGFSIGQDGAISANSGNQFTPSVIRDVLDETGKVVWSSGKTAAARTIQTAEGQIVDPGLLTRAIKATAAENVPLSQHTILGPKVAAIRQGVPANKWGGDIGAATQLVMKGDEDALRIFGPALSQQLIQNKIAHLVRQTGAPEETIRRGLSVMGRDAAIAPVEQVAIIGNNAKVVDDALVAAVTPKTLAGLLDDVPGGPTPGFRRSAEDLVSGRPVPAAPPGGGGGYVPPPRMGNMRPDAPLPEIPPQSVTRGSAGQTAGDVFDEVNALWRGALAGADVSTVGLQGAMQVTKEVTKLPFYAVTGKFGGTQRPYLHTAFGRLFQALVADLPHTPGQALRALKPGTATPRINQITQGFIDEAEKLGLSTKKVGTRPADIRIADPLGGMTAREELAAGKIIQGIPVIGGLYRQANFATMSFLNALRVGEVKNLKRAFDGMQMKFEPQRAGHVANITTGYGDLLLANGEYADTVARLMQRVFFGPRLMTSAVQNVTDTILSLRNVGGQVMRNPMIQKTRLNPVDVSRIHATTSFVATGVGIMKLAEASGLAIGLDPEATDFGRITLPGGRRLDFWGPYNEEARLIARELALVSQPVGEFLGLRPPQKPKYGAKTGEQLLFDYVINKFGPFASAINSLRVGRNMAGLTPREVIDSTIANPNPFSNPDSMVPAPFSGTSAAEAFDPAQGGQGGAQGVFESAAGVLGFTVLPPNKYINYDGFGRPETDRAFGTDAVFDEHARLYPDKLFAAPDATIGSGNHKVPVPPTERAAYVQMVGNQRRIDLGNLIYSDEYQNATKAQQINMFEAAKTKADQTANREYLRDSVIESTDPATIRAEAVGGFHAQGTNQKNRAYWVALLDKAGKLTSDVKQAIDESNVPSPSNPYPITVDEYLKAAPLVHQYLRHAPYGTDKSPIGTPQDWVAVNEAKEQTGPLRDKYIRSGMAPAQAETQAKVDVLKQLRNMVQRSLYINGASLVNPQRKLLELRYKTMLTRFLGPAKDYTRETAADYP